MVTEVEQFDFTPSEKRDFEIGLNVCVQRETEYHLEQAYLRLVGMHFYGRSVGPSEHVRHA